MTFNCTTTLERTLKNSLSHIYTHTHTHSAAVTKDSFRNSLGATTVDWLAYILLNVPPAQSQNTAFIILFTFHSKEMETSGQSLTGHFVLLSFHVEMSQTVGRLKNLQAKGNPWYSSSLYACHWCLFTTDLTGQNPIETFSSASIPTVYLSVHTHTLSPQWVVANVIVHLTWLGMKLHYWWLLRRRRSNPV